MRQIAVLDTLADGRLIRTVCQDLEEAVSLYRMARHFPFIVRTTLVEKIIDECGISLAYLDWSSYNKPTPDQALTT
jgi:hypothetical protein